MSLDVSLIAKEPVKRSRTGVFIREGGKSRELTADEVALKFDGATVAPIEYKTTEVYSANITHNLGKMAAEAGIYDCLWRPDENNITTASQLIPLLDKGLKALRAQPTLFKKREPANGWGSYDSLVEFVANYLNACRTWPDATVEVSR